MTDEITVDDFDSILESSEPVETSIAKRRPNSVIQDLIVNVDVAKQLASGEKTVAELAKELGVSQATIYKKMKTAAMKDLLAINSRRILSHLAKRDLSKEKFLSLAASANYFLQAEERINNAGLGIEDRIINQTNIEQINILLQGRGNEGQGAKIGGSVPILESREIPEIPEESIQAGTRSTEGDNSGGEEG